MLTKQHLRNQRELIQNDLQCLLDGADEQQIDKACQIIVDRFKILIDQIDQLPNKKSRKATHDPVCYFRCEVCGALTTAPTSDVKAVGHPICPNECGNEETTEITKAEYLEFSKGE